MGSRTVAGWKGVEGVGWKEERKKERKEGRKERRVEECDDNTGQTGGRREGQMGTGGMGGALMQTWSELSGGGVTL